MNSIDTRALGRARTIDMTGQRVGKLIVISQAPTAGMNARWRCKCDCGGERVVDGNRLRVALRDGAVSSNERLPND